MGAKVMASNNVKHLENCFDKPAGMRVKSVPGRLPWPQDVTQEDVKYMIENSILGCYWRVRQEN
jgi:hypothetical protein